MPTYSLTKYTCTYVLEKHAYFNKGVYFHFSFYTYIAITAVPIFVSLDFLSCVR